jgi:PKHD-type hydroxylase
MELRMTNQADYFDKNRFIYLSGVLSKEVCEHLTKHMFDLYNQGKLVKDEQCPLSNSVYGNPVFDKILGDLAAPLSSQLGVELLPCYTYARIYRPGEVLKRHTDREACEISGTMTLGFDPGSELWPIFFGKDATDEVGTPINIDVGDLVMYRGNELTHWRPEYKGLWQVQVFFHFVDANGPHKDHAFDKRPALGMVCDKDAKSGSIYAKIQDDGRLLSDMKAKPFIDEPRRHFNPPIFGNCVMIPSQDVEMPGASVYHSNFKPEMMFTKEECEKIIAFAANKYGTKATVGTQVDGKYAPEIRRVEQYTIDLTPENAWIFNKIANAVGLANHEYYKYELMGITHGLQLLHYKDDEQSFYDWHTDIGQGNAATRKLSLSVHLSDPKDYEGGDLIVNDHGIIINSIKEQGCINMFPSYALHKVTPVTRGHRWVIVSWIHGSQRFK